MVVSEVISRIKVKELIFIFLFQAHRDSALENHIHLCEVAILPYDYLIVDKNTAVKRRNEIADELAATENFLAFKIQDEQMGKFLLYELAEQLFNQFLPKSWLQLVEEVIVLTQFFVVVEH